VSEYVSMSCFQTIVSSLCLPHCSYPYENMKSDKFITFISKNLRNCTKSSVFIDVYVDTCNLIFILIV